MDNKQIVEEIENIKKSLSAINEKSQAELPANADLSVVMKYLMETRERTNRLMDDMMQKIRMLESELNSMELGQGQENFGMPTNREVELSGVDAKIIDFIQTRKDGLACADDVREYMNYKGNNAACARLNRMKMMGLLERHQLGHKVYYKFDAGKATNTLIVSPP